MRLHRLHIISFISFWSFWLGLVIAVAAVPSSASAQEATASMGLGAGLFDSSMATSVDVGMDMSGEDWWMGFGARVRWTEAESLRTTEWDERSEWTRLLRYFRHRHEDGSFSASVAAGDLGGVRVGHGALISGYTTGLQVDHRWLGVHVHMQGQSLGVEAVVDDLVAPRIAGGRGSWRWFGDFLVIEAGASVAADLSAPEWVDPMLAEAALPMASVDASVGVHSLDERLHAAVYSEAATISTMATGVHVGALAQAMLGSTTQVEVRAEARLGTDQYVPGWIGPLYEIERHKAIEAEGEVAVAPSPLLDVARAGGLGGMGMAIGIEAEDPGLGGVHLSYAQRPGLSDVAMARLTAPYYRLFQLSARAATQLGPGPRVWTMIGEARAQVTSRWFVGAEVGRLYRDVDQDLVATWLGTLLVGASMSVP